MGTASPVTAAATVDTSGLSHPMGSTSRRTATAKPTIGAICPFLVREVTLPPGTGAGGT